MSRDGSALSVGGGGELPQHARTSTHEIVFDGVLFDRDELARRMGVVAETALDNAELVLKLYAQLGTSLFDELRGVFAVIVLDRRDGTLVATRDPLGMHPLFYSSIGSSVVFSWSIDGLLDAGAARDVNRRFVAEHLLHRWSAVDETYFTSIRRVPAGHYLAARESLSLAQYWRDVDEAEPETVSDWLDAFEAHLDQGVTRCLTLGRAGVYLSGGADSVNVAISAAELARARDTKPPVALTVTFPDEGANEDVMQDRVARALGMPRLTASAPEAAERPVETSLRRAAERGAPVGAIWDEAYRTLGVHAKESGCRVLLDGEGGDEWLAPRPQLAADLLRRMQLWRVARLLRNDARARGWRRMPALTASAWRYALRPVLHEAATARMARRAPAIHARYREARHPIPPWISSDRALRAALAERIDRADIATLWHPLVSMHLEDSYATGRALGVPLLHPLWDVDLVRLLAAASPEVLQLGNQPKGLAVESARRRLPALGRDWPRRATADAFLERVVTQDAMSRPRGELFERLGILEPGAVPPRIQTSGRGNPLSSRDLLAIFTAEAWISRRVEDL